METIITKKIKTKLDELDFGYFDEDVEDFIGIEQNHQDVQDKFNLSDDAMSALTMFLSDVKEYITTDLADIWDRLDYIEKKAFED